MNRQSRLRMVTLTAVATITAGSLLLATATDVGASNKPTASWTNVSGYSLAIAGAGWLSGDRLTFALYQGNTYGLEFRADKSGNFEIGIKNFSCSGGGVGSVRDFAGQTAMPPVMDPCGPGNRTVPSFVVLDGSAVNPHTTYVSGLGNGKVVTMRRGGILALWEKGKSSPTAVPSAPKKFFTQIGYMAGPNPLCAAAKCPDGFLWQWVATTTGHTGISLGPWCGSQPCPEDWMVLLRVNIRRM